MKIKFLTFFCLAAALFLAACGKSDADVQKAVTDKLKADNVAGVTATVKDGVATLTGEVADITVKNKAEASAKTVEGVKSVTNSVTLKTPSIPIPPPVDPMLKGKVEEALKKAGCTGVTIEVKDGKISAGGTVADAKFGECVQVINQSGALGFQNNIQKGK